MTKHKRKRNRINVEETETIFWNGTRKELGPLLLLGISTLTLWISMWIFGKGQILIVQVILKFIVYLSMILWLNSTFYMRELALGTNVDTFKFQKKQVKFTLWIFSMFILMEIPMWIDVFLTH